MRGLQTIAAANKAAEARVALTGHRTHPDFAAERLYQQRALMGLISPEQLGQLDARLNTPKTPILMAAAKKAGLPVIELKLSRDETDPAN